MSIEKEFIKYHDIWGDCSLGYVISENKSGLSGLAAIKVIISENTKFNFHPWLDTKEEISLPENGINQRSKNEAQKLFLIMAKEAISYGSDKQLSDSELNRLFHSFFSSVGDGEFFANFSNNSWQPVTKHTRDCLLCLVGKEKIGMWFSCDDE